MKKYMLGLVAIATVAMGGAATADCAGRADSPCGKYDVRLTVNGNPYYGKWAIVNDRPYVGIEAFSDYVGVPRAHYYQGWSFAKTPSETISPLDLNVMVEQQKVDTIRFAGVTMVDLNQAASALGVPVHRDLQRRIIQVGHTGYTGEQMKGKWYRHLSRARGWTNEDWRPNFDQRFQHEDDHGPQSLKRL